MSLTRKHLHMTFGDDADRSWPDLPPAYSHTVVTDDTWRLYRQLCASVDLTRGLLPSDLPVAMSAAQSFAEAAHWREVQAGLRALETQVGERLGDLVKASRAARQCEASYVASAMALGLRGDQFGAGKTKRVRAAVGFDPNRSRWEGAGLADSAPRRGVGSRERR